MCMIGSRTQVERETPCKETARNQEPRRCDKVWELRPLKSSPYLMPENAFARNRQIRPEALPRQKRDYWSDVRPQEVCSNHLMYLYRGPMNFSVSHMYYELHARWAKNYVNRLLHTVMFLSLAKVSVSTPLFYQVSTSDR